MNATVPSALVSCGPVNTSPEGMLRRPSELTHLRFLTFSVRSVPGASSRSVLASLSCVISFSWKRRNDAHAATGSGPVRNIAPATNAVNASSSIPAWSASAWVGHSDEHQVFFIAADWISWRARRRRVIRSGSMPVSALVSCGAWIGQVLLGVLGLAPHRLRHVVELAALGVEEEVAGLAGQLGAQQRPRAALEDRALELQQQRLGVGRRADEHLVARSDLEAVADEQIGEARRVERRHVAHPSYSACRGSAVSAFSTAPSAVTAAPGARGGRRCPSRRSATPARRAGRRRRLTSMSWSVSSAPRAAASSMPSGGRTASSECELLAVGGEALEAELRQRGAQRGRARWRGVPSAPRAPPRAPRRAPRAARRPC